LAAVASTGSPSAMSVDPALDHDAVDTLGALVEALDDLVGALAAHAAVADLQVGVLALRPALPLALRIVAEGQSPAQARVRLVAGVSGGDRVAEGGDHPMIAAASTATTGRQQKRRGRRESDDPQEYIPVNWPPVTLIT